MAESVSALNADIVWHANTGQAEVDIEKLRRTFYTTTHEMSTQSLKLQSAQERLDRTLVKYGTSSRQARDAEIALRREMEAGTVTAGRHSNAIKQEEQSIGRMARGAVTGSGAIRGLARAAVFASSSFLGGFGIIYAIRTFVDAAERQQLAIHQTRQALERQGVSWADHRKQIDETIQAQSRLSAFDDEELYQSFTALFRRTGDVTEALKLNALAANVARGRNIDLNTAVTLVTRASIGQVGSLRRLGLDVQQVTTHQDELRASTTNITKAQLDQAKAADKAATAAQVQTLLLQKYGGAAEAFGNTAAGAQAKFSKTLQDTEEIIGRALLPELTHLLTTGGAYLDRMNRTGQVQRDVNKVIRTGAEVARGLGEGFHVIKLAAEPLISLFGGIEGTAKAMIEAFALYKLLRIAQSIRGLGIAAQFSRREITLLNETPVVTKGPGGVLVGKGGGGAGVGRFSGLPLGGAAVVAYTIFTTPGDQGAQPGQPNFGRYPGGQYPILNQLARDQNFPGSIPDQAKAAPTSAIFERWRRGQITAAQAERLLQQLNPYGARITGASGSTSDRSPGRSPGGSASAGVPASSGGSKKPPVRRPIRPHEFALPQNLVIEEARAGTLGEAAQLKASQDELRYVKAQIASGHLTPTALANAYDEEARLLSQIDQIHQARAQRAADAERKREEAHRKAVAEEKRRKAAAERRAKELERAREARIRADLGLDERKLTNQLLKAQLTTTLADDRAAYEAERAFFRKEEHDRRLTDRERQDFVTKELRARKAEAALTKAKKASDQNFFADAAAEFRTYGSNIALEAGSPLSGQDARAGLAYEILVELKTANRLARERTKHTKETAQSTSKIGKGSNAAKVAAALADVGAWTGG